MHLLLELRTDRPAKDGRCALRLRIHHNGTHRRLSTGIAILPEHWDHQRQRVKKSHPAHHAVNDRIAELLERTEAAVLTGRDPRQHRTARDGFAQAWERHIQRPGLADSTRAALRVVLHTVEAFDPGVRLDAIDRAWMLRFGEWMARRYRRNTVYTRIKKTRMAVDELRREAGLPPIDLRRLGFREEETWHKALQPDEVDRLLSVVPAGKWERLALDLFTVSFFTGGMRFGDLCRMDRSWIRGEWIEYRHAKTGAVRPIPLTGQVQAVLARYPRKGLWNPLSKGKSSANVMVNKALKVLARKAGVEGAVSMNYARHSFAEYAVTKGVALEVVSRILGHTTTSTTEVYLNKINRQPVADAFGRLFDKGGDGPP